MEPTDFTSYTNMCWIIGQLIAAGTLRGLVSRQDSWGYRIPFALQWVWPIFLIPGIYLAPESPWFLVRKDRFDDAEKAIRRLQSASSRQSPKNTLAGIVYTNNLEVQLSIGTTYWDCFKGFELRRTEIACVVFGGQLVCGSVSPLRRPLETEDLANFVRFSHMHQLTSSSKLAWILLKPILWDLVRPLWLCWPVLPIGFYSCHTLVVEQFTLGVCLVWQYN